MVTAVQHSTLLEDVKEIAYYPTAYLLNFSDDEDDKEK